MKTISSRSLSYRTPIRSLNAAAAAECLPEGGYWAAAPSDALGASRPCVPESRSELLSTLCPDMSGGSVVRLRDVASGPSPRNTLLGGAPKRAVDIVIALGVAILILPLLLAIATAIRATMGGPVIYRHRRIGCLGREFDCLKFRTMVTNSDAVLAALLASDPAAAAEWRETQKLVCDPRITWLGHALRRSSLDELPQLLNVIRGDMSCVGPRPIVRGELVRYGVHGDLFQRVRPGMTGLWQVSGRSTLGYDERVTLDCKYVSEWSIWCDAKILLRTIPAALKTRQTS